MLRHRLIHDFFFCLKQASGLHVLASDNGKVNRQGGAFIRARFPRLAHLRYHDFLVPSLALRQNSRPVAVITLRIFDTAGMSVVTEEKYTTRWLMHRRGVLENVNAAFMMNTLRCTNVSVNLVEHLESCERLPLVITSSGGAMELRGCWHMCFKANGPFLH